MAAEVGSVEEVKALQDLVKKLERQNELLRSKADGIGSTDQELSVSPSSNTNKPDTASKLKKNDETSGSTNNLLESVKLLDLNILEDDEDTWLYTSPIRAPTPEQKVVDPRSWVRQDFENPEPDEKMKSAKKALLAKLDEVSRANRNSMGPNAFIAPSQVPALSQQTSATATASTTPRPTSPRPTSPRPASPPTAPSSSAMHNHTSPSHSPIHSPSHSKSSSASSSLNNVVDPSLGVGILDTSPISSPPNTPSRKESRERKGSEERLSFAKLEDVTDVQILAKMQEDSLRQATQQSPANSPRRMVSASSDQALHRAVSRTSSQSSMCSDKDEVDIDMMSPRQANTGVVRRRPSLERLRKNTEQGNVRRYSYGAKYPSNHVNDNGDAITLAELQKLAQAKKAQRHTNSLPNLNRTSPVQPNSKISPMSEGKKNRLKQPNNLPRKRSTATDSANKKKTEKAKGHSGSLPNLNSSPRNGQQQQQQQQSNSNSHQPAINTEPVEPKVKQPNSVPMKRSTTTAPNSKSSLRQPSPTKLRAASPSRSGIPVRLSMNERSAIPRPRSAIISPRINASTLPRASAQNSNRTSVRSKDDSWREGCY